MHHQIQSRGWKSCAKTSCVTCGRTRSSTCATRTAWRTRSPSSRLRRRCTLDFGTRARRTSDRISEKPFMVVVVCGEWCGLRWTDALRHVSRTDRVSRNLASSQRNRGLPRSERPRRSPRHEGRSGGTDCAPLGGPLASPPRLGDARRAGGDAGWRGTARAGGNRARAPVREPPLVRALNDTGGRSKRELSALSAFIARVV